MFKCYVLAIFIAISATGFAMSASIEKAILLNEHGLSSDAKRELIDLIFQKEIEDAHKAHAYYLLGNIAFDEDKIKVALNSWQHLVDNYPNSKETGLIKERIAELSEIVFKSTKENLDNAVARSYLRHANFWSKGKSDVFNIDTSWVSNVDAAVKWYDKIITEFPKSNAARIAYEDKLKTLLGWEDVDRESYGMKRHFLAYMDILINTFNDFENDYPEASSLQAFRFQIAQTLSLKGIVSSIDKPITNTKRLQYLEQAEMWLNNIINNAGETDSFYRDLAERRKIKVTEFIDKLRAEVLKTQNRKPLKRGRR